MVNSLSGVSFGNQIGAMDKVSQEQMYSPGLYSMPELMGPPPEYRKKSSFLGFLGKLVLTAAIIGGGAVAANKFLPKIKNATLVKDLPKEGAKTMDKIYGRIKQLGEWVESSVKKIFSKKTLSENEKTGTTTSASDATNADSKFEAKA